jgi:hypothetical protein
LNEIAKLRHNSGNIVYNDVFISSFKEVCHCSTGMSLNSGYLVI